jgi:methionyl-tRNA formyltransferase
MRIVVLSTRTLGEKIVERLVERGEDVVAVGNSPVRAGVTDRMQQVALKYGIPFLKVKNASSLEFFDEYSKLRPDINIMGGLRAFLPESVLNYPKLGTLGWHPSLLPKYAGANSLCWPIIFGENKTANTVFWADKGIDSGPIVLQKEVEISPDDTFGSLYSNKIVPGAVETIMEAVDLVKKGIAPRIPQDLSQYSYYSFITEKDAIINWVQPGRQIYNLIRGTNPLPGATTNFGDRIFKVLDSELHVGFEGAVIEAVTTGVLKTGTVIDVTGEGIQVAVPDGAILIKEISVEGSKMTAAGFAKQVGLIAGSRLGTL